MKSLRNRFERFCFKHRNKGIPNLMLYIALGNALVIVMSMINGGDSLYNMLYFDKTLILQGQVWRLFTYVFTQSGTGFLNLIFLYFFYILGSYIERGMGTLKFNLYYFSGVILMDVFAMIFCPTTPDHILTNAEYTYLSNVLPVYWQMAYFLHLSLILTYATTHPDSHFMIFFIIPVRAWLIALIYLVLNLISIFNLSYPVMYFPHNLFPLVALANYFLYVGKDIKNLLPLSWRVRKNRSSRKNAHKQPQVIPFPNSNAEKAASQKASVPYTHRCTVCGRTDISHPDLEFRYCSRCQGYHCYCIDHINDHTHIE